MSTPADTSNAKAAGCGTGCFMLIVFMFLVPFLLVSLPVLIIVGLAFLVIGGLTAANAYFKVKSEEAEKRDK